MSDSHVPPICRRALLQAVGAGPSGVAPENAGFSPPAKPRKISDNLFVLEDTCNVYLIRSFRDKETFRREEHEFTVVYSSGHTKYQMALFATIDGERIAFTGDAFFNDAAKPSEMRHNPIYRNRVKSGDHLLSIRNIMDFPASRHRSRTWAAVLDRCRHGATVRRENETPGRILRGSHCGCGCGCGCGCDTDIGLDPSWVEVYPYQGLIVPGQTRQYEIRVRNLRKRAIEVEAALALPAGWRSDPASVRLRLEAGASGEAPVSIGVPAGWRGPESRVAMALDVVVDGKYLGQIAEAVVDVRSSKL